jgi:hypothetical protein
MQLFPAKYITIKPILHKNYTNIELKCPSNSGTPFKRLKERKNSGKEIWLWQK